jgi:hypothetical protein
VYISDFNPIYELVNNTAQQMNGDLMNGYSFLTANIWMGKVFTLGRDVKTPAAPLANFSKVASSGQLETSTLPQTDMLLSG